MHLASRAAPCGARWGTCSEVGFVFEMPPFLAPPLVPSTVTYCVDLGTGLVSAEDVGEFGAAWNNAVLGELQVEGSFAGPRFVTVTAVTAKSIEYPLFSLSGSHDHLNSADIIHGRRDDPPGHPQTRCPTGTPSSTAVRRLDPSSPLIRCNK